MYSFGYILQTAESNSYSHPAHLFRLGRAVHIQSYISRAFYRHQHSLGNRLRNTGYSGAGSYDSCKTALQIVSKKIKLKKGLSP